MSLTLHGREDGELTEISRNFFATCNRDNSVVYFGEEVNIYEDGEVVAHEGEWRAGDDDARPGIIMPAPTCWEPGTSRSWRRAWHWTGRRRSA